MKTVGAYAAKTHFSRLLDEVQAGEEIAITRNGKTVARLVPEASDRDDICLAADELLRLQKDLSLGDLTIREMVKYGRRF